MEFRWAAFIALWTILSGPVFEFPRGHIPVAISEDYQDIEADAAEANAEGESREDAEYVAVPE